MCLQCLGGHMCVQVSRQVLVVQVQAHAQAQRSQQRPAAPVGIPQLQVRRRGRRSSDGGGGGGVFS